MGPKVYKKRNHAKTSLCTSSRRSREKSPSVTSRVAILGLRSTCRTGTSRLARHQRLGQLPARCFVRRLVKSSSLIPRYRFRTWNLSFTRSINVRFDGSRTEQCCSLLVVDWIRWTVGTKNLACGRRTALCRAR